MTKNILWVVVSCLMVLSLVMVACGPSDEGEIVEEEVVGEKEMKEVTLTKLNGSTVTKMVEKPKYGGTLTIAVNIDRQYFDPAMHTSPSVQPLLPFSVLIGGDPERGPAGTGETDWSQGNFMGKVGFYRPELCESYEIIDDETIVFKIRKGAHFALNPDSEASRLVNGREVTAEDVAYSYDRQWHQTGKSYHAVNEPLNKIVSAKALDKYTFELKINPNTHGLHLIQSAARVSIYAKEVIDKYGDMMDWRNVVGSGPFMLTDYVGDTSRTYKKNTNYFEMDPWFEENRLPYLDGITFLAIPDLSTRQAALRTGKTDYMYSVTSDDKEQFSKDESRLLSRVQHTNPYTLTARMDDPSLPWAPQDDPNAIKVRTAMNLAINKQAIVDSFYQGNGAVFGWPWPDWTEMEGIYEPLSTYPEELQELFEYKPEKAKQLLTEAGYPDGFKAIVTITAVQADYVAILANDLAKVGIELELDQKETAVWQNMIREKTYPHMIRDINRMSQSPVRYHGARLPSQWNYGFFETPITRAVYDEANKTLGRDDAKVAELWKSISQHYLEMVPLVMLPEEHQFVVWWPWLKRWQGARNIGSWHPDSGAFYWLWIDQDMKKEMGF